MISNPNSSCTYATPEFLIAAVTLLFIAAVTLLFIFDYGRSLCMN